MTDQSPQRTQGDSIAPQTAVSGKKETNKKATWSLVGGILSVTVCGLIVGIATVVGITYAGG